MNNSLKDFKSSGEEKLEIREEFYNLYVEGFNLLENINCELEQ